MTELTKEKSVEGMAVRGFLPLGNAIAQQWAENPRSS